VARAQQPAIPVVGFLTNATESSMRGELAVFLRGLSEQGFVEGRNVEVLSRHAESQEDRLPALAADLVQRRVAVIFVAPNVGFARIAKNRFLPPVATLWNTVSWRI
jgi:putative tryptophan/tyrosine transport system substrate-binding protein